MKTKVVNIEVVDYVAERGSHKGEKGQYVVLTVENRGSNWIASVNQNEKKINITRPQSLVDTWLDFAKQMKDTKKPIEQVVPDEFRLIDRVFRVNVKTEKLFRVYRKAQIDAKSGKVLHEKGEVYTLEDGKTPSVYDSLDVLAIQYEDDDTGEYKWVQTPESIVRDLINRGYYRPVEVNTAPAEELSAKDADEAEAGDTEAPGEESKGEPTEEELLKQIEELRAKRQGS